MLFFLLSYSYSWCLLYHSLEHDSIVALTAASAGIFPDRCGVQENGKETHYTCIFGHSALYEKIYEECL